MHTLLHPLLSLWSSSVGRKALVAASGLLLWAWLVLHALAILTAFSGPAAIDGYARGLREAAPLLWGMRAGLLGLAVVHLAGIVSLYRQARAARPRGPVLRVRRVSTFASRTARASGALLLAFLVLHLLHLTFGTLHPDFVPGAVHHNLVTGLRAPLVATGYLAAVLLLGLHLFHGLWAAQRSLGIRQSSAPVRRRPVVALLVVALTAAFAAVPLAVALGRLR